MVRTLVIVAGLLVGMTVAQGATLEVGDGREYQTITEAIAAAADGDVLMAYPGVYEENVDFGDKTLTLQTLEPTNGTVRAATVIDGGEAGPVIRIPATASGTVVKGFTIRKGTSTDPGSGRGGGIVAEGSCTIADNEFRSCTALEGGGVAVSTAAPHGGSFTVTRNYFADCTAQVSGGAIHATGAGLITSNRIVRSSAPVGGGVCAEGFSGEMRYNYFRGTAVNQGGGVALAGGGPEVHNNRFEGCSVGGGAGGGLHCAATLAGLVVRDNEFTACSAGTGGGLYSDVEAQGMVRGNNIHNNSAINGGGGYLAGPMGLENNTFRANTCTQDGAGVYLDGSGLVAGNVFAQNQAVNYGGGVLCDGPAALRHNVIYGNSAISGGGGVTLCATPTVFEFNTLHGNGGDGAGNLLCDTGEPVAISNCLISSATSGGGIRCISGSVLQARYCNVWGNPGGDYVDTPDVTGSLGNLSVNPLYVAAAAGDFHLQSQGGHWCGGINGWVHDLMTSPCIDAGDPASPFVNERSPNGGRVNMGAYGNTAQASRNGNIAPTAPTQVKVSPMLPGPGDNLRVVASGATDANGDSLVYRAQWRKRPSKAAEWGPWVTGALVVKASQTAAGEQWQARVRAYDGSRSSGWTEGNSATVYSMIGSSSPASGATTALRGGKIVVTFKWLIQQASAEERFRLYRVDGGGETELPGTVSWLKANQKLQFTPDQPLQPGTEHRVALGSGIQRIAGGVMGWEEGFSFTTGLEPVVLSTNPTGNSVMTDSAIEVAFDQRMNRPTVLANFGIMPLVSGSFSWPNDHTVRFTPHQPLQPGTTYMVMLGRNLKSATGRVMRVPVSWEFTTTAGAALAMTANAATAPGGTSALTVSLSCAAEVQVSIRNIAGRAVAALPAQTLSAGVSTLLWNGRSHSGSSVAPGRYLVEVRAVSGSTQTSCLTSLQR